MSQTIQPGIFEAKISNYAITTTQGGDPQVAILFDYNDHEGTPHEITWFGTLKEGKGQEITLKTLLYCGFAGTDPAELASGVESNLLDTVTPVKITIEENNYNGKTSMRVQWVNRIGGNMAGKLSASEAKVKMGALNLKAQLEMIRQSTGIAKPAAKAQAKVAATREPGEDDDIDFTGFSA